ncbi:MAG: hypothetical protein KDK40_01120, partial [Chlamydiia bacterium]|nr:hypothetical protein [Chlamydiia bacterium]
MLMSPSSKASIRVGQVFPCLFFYLTKFLLDSDSRGWNYEICEKFIDENDCDDQRVNQRNWIRIFQAIDELTSTQLELAFFYFKYAFNNYAYHRY